MTPLEVMWSMLDCCCAEGEECISMRFKVSLWLLWQDFYNVDLY